MQFLRGMFNKSSKQRSFGPGKQKTPLSSENDNEVVKANLDRLAYAKRVGHTAYVDQAVLCERMYLGGGKQWSDADRAARTEQGKPCIELNHIMPAVNTSLGIQLHSRVDMDFQPRGDGADAQKAEVLSKVIKQICDQAEYAWKESQQYEDGQIMQRGFLDFRMDFSTNIQGEVTIDILDPLDSFPDPDAQSYDPSSWADFTAAKWMSRDQIAVLYGEELADRVQNEADMFFDGRDEYQDRSHFGEDADGTGGDALWVTQGHKDFVSSRLFYVVDRQYKKLVRNKVLIMPTGEKKPMSMINEEQLAEAMEAGSYTMNDLVTQIHWAVTCGNVVLFNGQSPYPTYTVVPYFPIFRRGQTRGMVDNLIGPQELENKSITNYLEIWSSNSNSGWNVEENSLANMETADLEVYGGLDGLVTVYRKGFQPPQRREASQAPMGADRLIDRAEGAVKTISGMSDAMQGGSAAKEVSGIALENKQYLGQMQQGRPMDNLARTRRMSAKKLVELVQMFYTDERVFRIVDPETGDMTEELTINQVDDYGQILNNVTIGTYDVVITDTPTHATFRQNQFEQILALVEKGIPIRPSRVVLSSTLSDKNEIAKEVAEDSQSQGADPVAESTIALNSARAELTAAQTDKTKAETVNTTVESQYSSIQTAGVIAATPQTALLADEIYLSAGGMDHNAAPVFPTMGAGAQPVDDGGGMFPVNTNPTTPVPPPDPASPMVGVRQGIETQRIEEV